MKTILYLICIAGLLMTAGCVIVPADRDHGGHWGHHEDHGWHGGDHDEHR